ncbi:hypothetical protein CU098_001870 [Rhizopus stolonifer]|uniref:Uncharacterized protein n=1 Tax=Rhizopus stolonifer TaxID=4846 RepID=A0A367KRI7_RHIST|nr:hypothetical protein CU098_001870 [Rhizopus stolonifer]
MSRQRGVEHLGEDDSEASQTFEYSEDGSYSSSYESSCSTGSDSYEYECSESDFLHSDEEASISSTGTHTTSSEEEEEEDSEETFEIDFEDLNKMDELYKDWCIKRNTHKDNSTQAESSSASTGWSNWKPENLMEYEKAKPSAPKVEVPDSAVYYNGLCFAPEKKVPYSSKDKYSPKGSPSQPPKYNKKEPDLETDTMNPWSLATPDKLLEAEKAAATSTKKNDLLFGSIVVCIPCQKADHRIDKPCLEHSTAAKSSSLSEESLKKVESKLINNVSSSPTIAEHSNNQDLTCASQSSTNSNCASEQVQNITAQTSTAFGLVQDQNILQTSINNDNNIKIPQASEKDDASIHFTSEPSVNNDYAAVQIPQPTVNDDIKICIPQPLSSNNNTDTHNSQSSKNDYNTNTYIIEPSVNVDKFSFNSQTSTKSYNNNSLITKSSTSMQNNAGDFVNQSSTNCNDTIKQHENFENIHDNDAVSSPSTNAWNAFALKESLANTSFFSNRPLSRTDSKRHPNRRSSNSSVASKSPRMFGSVSSNTNSNVHISNLVTNETVGTDEKHVSTWSNTLKETSTATEKTSTNQWSAATRNNTEVVSIKEQPVAAEGDKSKEINTAAELTKTDEWASATWGSIFEQNSRSTKLPKSEQNSVTAETTSTNKVPTATWSTSPKQTSVTSETTSTNKLSATTWDHTSKENVTTDKVTNSNNKWSATTWNSTESISTATENTNDNQWSTTSWNNTDTVGKNGQPVAAWDSTSTKVSIATENTSTNQWTTTVWNNTEAISVDEQPVATWGETSKETSIATENANADQWSTTSWNKTEAVSTSELPVATLNHKPKEINTAAELTKTDEWASATWGSIFEQNSRSTKLPNITGLRNKTVRSNYSNISSSNNSVIANDIPEKKSPFIPSESLRKLELNSNTASSTTQEDNSTSVPIIPPVPVVSPVPVHKPVVSPEPEHVPVVSPEPEHVVSLEPEHVVSLEPEHEPEHEPVASLELEHEPENVPSLKNGSSTTKINGKSSCTSNGISSEPKYQSTMNNNAIPFNPNEPSYKKKFTQFNPKSAAEKSQNWRSRPTRNYQHDSNGVHDYSNNEGTNGLLEDSSEINKMPNYENDNANYDYHYNNQEAISNGGTTAPSTEESPDLTTAATSTHDDSDVKIVLDDEDDPDWLENQMVFGIAPPDKTIDDTMAAGGQYYEIQGVYRPEFIPGVSQAHYSQAHCMPAFYTHAGAMNGGMNHSYAPMVSYGPDGQSLYTMAYPLYQPPHGHMTSYDYGNQANQIPSNSYYYPSVPVLYEANGMVYYGVNAPMYPPYYYPQQAYGDYPEDQSS